MDPNAIATVKAAKPHQSMVTDCLRAFLGMEKRGSLITDFANLSFCNVILGEEPVLELEFALA
jgi:hypothetical protein